MVASHSDDFFEKVSCSFDFSERWDLDFKVSDGACEHEAHLAEDVCDDCDHLELDPNHELVEAVVHFVVTLDLIWHLL